MMRLLGAGVITVGESVALSLIAKATVITAFAVLAGWLTRRRRASVRHLIFVAAFAGLALLPVAAAVIPAVPVPVRLLAMPAIGDTVLSAPVNRAVESSMFVEERPSWSRVGMLTGPALSTFTLLQTMWLAGMIGCLVPVAVGLWQVRPVIIFPPDAPTWSEDDVQRALAHELEHVQRRDWVTLCLARAICAVYWFHPLVWIANRQLCVNAERACDDAVLRDSQAFGYADQLVALAERSLAQTRRPLLAMANRGDLSTRVRAVLNIHQQRGPAGLRVRIAVASAAIILVGLLAPVLTVATALGQATAATARPQFDVASIKPSFSNGIMNVRPLPSRLVADATLQILMQHAYGVQAFQVVGGPGWLSTDRYEIDATAGAAVRRDQLSLMLQSLLEDRFRLKTHRDIKELPVYALLSDRGAFRLPPPREGACVDSAADAAVEWAGGRMAVPGELPTAKGRCGSVVATLGQLRGGKVAMSELVRVLSLVLDRTVL